MNDPQQELFSEIKEAVAALGYTVYDGDLPPEDAPYPFVYMGDFRQSDIQNKTGICGVVRPVIHVWMNNPQRRGTLSKMLFDIKKVLWHIEDTDSYAWMVKNITQSIFPDNTTKQPLMHGVIEGDFYFS